MKKILILGGNFSTVDVVREAKANGYFTVVVDNRESGPAKDIADKSLLISTADIKSLVRLVREENINGIFTGPSEFNIRNCIRVAEETGLRFYCNRDQWNMATNKSSFKELCVRHSIPTVPSYPVKGDIATADLSHLHYPVMVKPADSSGSRGLFVCNNEHDTRASYATAQTISADGSALIEHYFDDFECGFAAHYIVIEGRAHLSLTSDKYIVDQRDGLHINAASLFPSLITDYYQKTIHPQIQNLIKDIGLSNGVCFFQALVKDGRLYFHEMELRLGGGLVSKFTTKLQGVNSIAMMVRNAVGDPMCSEDEEDRITPIFDDIVFGTLSIPLECGTITAVHGLDSILEHPQFLDFMQAHHIGDTIEREQIGTLSQLFGRFKYVAPDRKRAAEFIDWVQSQMIILDKNGRNMFSHQFDANRLAS